LEEEAFGIHLLSPDEWEEAGEAERGRDLAKQVEVKCRLVEEYNECKRN